MGGGGGAVMVVVFFCRRASQRDVSPRTREGGKGEGSGNLSVGCVDMKVNGREWGGGGGGALLFFVFLGSLLVPVSQSAGKDRGLSGGEEGFPLVRHAGPVEGLRAIMAGAGARASNPRRGGTSPIYGIF